MSEALVEAYTILASVPQELLSLGGDEASERTRYKLMGALLAAQEAADTEMARLEHGPTEEDAEASLDEEVIGHHKERARRGY